MLTKLKFSIDDFCRKHHNLIALIAITIAFISISLSTVVSHDALWVFRWTL